MSFFQGPVIAPPDPKSRAGEDITAFGALTFFYVIPPMILTGALGGLGVRFDFPMRSVELAKAVFPRLVIEQLNLASRFGPEIANAYLANFMTAALINIGLTFLMVISIVAIRWSNKDPIPRGHPVRTSSLWISLAATAGVFVFFAFVPLGTQNFLDDHRAFILKYAGNEIGFLLIRAFAFAWTVLLVLGPAERPR